MLLASVSIFAIAPLCHGQANETVIFDTGAESMVRSSDVQFALNAAQVAGGETQLGELALKQASDPAVKQFAQHLIEENQKISRDLQRTGAKQLMTVPDNATQQVISQRRGLLKLSGPQFDAAFINNLITDTRESINSFQREANKGKEPGMKSFAARTLPVLQARLEALEPLQRYKK